MDLLKLEEKINFAKQELVSRIDYMITKELNFKKNAIYYYKCNGSGYYFKFRKIEREHIIGEIITKGGKPKNNTFRIHWCYANQIQLVKNI